MHYCVYQITCNNSDIECVYVGSTKNLTMRKYHHNGRSKNEKHKVRLYTTIREHGGFSNWTVEAVETGTCETTFEIRSRERYYYDQLQPSLNMYRPQASKEVIKLYKVKSKKQWDIANQEKSKETMKQYYKNNREKIKQNVSNKVHCDACNCEHNKGNILAHNKSKKHIKNLELKNNESKSDL